MQQRHTTRILISIIVIILCIIGVAHYHSAQDTSQVNANHATTVQQSTQQQVNNKQSKLMSLVVQQASTSKNAKLRAYGQNRLLNQNIKKPIDAFSNIVYTWNDENQYDERQKLLAPYLSQSALQTKSVFASDKDNSGESSIKVQGEHCVEDSYRYGILSSNSHNIKVLLSVNFTPWETTFNETESTASTNQQWYVLTIDKSTNQITGIQKSYHANSI